MPWIPLQEWQPGFEPNLNTISAGSADFVDSTIVFTGVTNEPSGAAAYALWSADNIGGFIAGETVRVRVECTLADAETYTAPSDPNVRLASSSLPDIQTVWAGGVPATFDIELVNTADSQGQVDLWMQWGSGSGGTLFTGGNFEFRISVWMEEPLPPDPEPVGCFWTDLVNVTQDCGGAPDPGDGFYIVVNTESSGIALLTYQAGSYEKLDSPAVSAGWVRSTAYSPQYRELAIAQDTKIARFSTVGQPSEWVETHSTNAPGDVASLTYANGGESLVALSPFGGSPALRVIDTSSGGISDPGVTVLQNSPFVVASPTDAVLVLGHVYPNEPRFQLIDTETWEVLSPPSTMPTGWPVKAAFSSDGTMLAVLCTNGQTVVYDTTDWSVLANFTRKPNAAALAFSPDGTMLCVGTFGGAGNTLEVFETEGWTLLGGPEDPPYAGNLYAAAFSPDGDYLYACGYLAPGGTFGWGMLCAYDTATWEGGRVDESTSGTSAVGIVLVPAEVR